MYRKSKTKLVHINALISYSLLFIGKAENVFYKGLQKVSLQPSWLAVNTLQGGGAKILHLPFDFALRWGMRPLGKCLAFLYRQCPTMHHCTTLRKYNTFFKTKGTRFFSRRLNARTCASRFTIKVPARSTLASAELDRQAGSHTRRISHGDLATKQLCGRLKGRVRGRDKGSKRL